MTEPSFLPFSYPHPKQHPTLLMRKIPSHWWLSFPTSDLLLNKNPIYGSLSCIVNHVQMDAHSLHKSSGTMPGTQEAVGITQFYTPIYYHVITVTYLTVSYAHGSDRYHVMYVQCFKCIYSTCKMWYNTHNMSCALCYMHISLLHCFPNRGDPKLHTHCRTLLL
jgi:hypothetical protein